MNKTQAKVASIEDVEAMLDELAVISGPVGDNCKYKIIAGGLRGLADLIEKQGKRSTRRQRLAWFKTINWMAGDLA